MERSGELHLNELPEGCIANVLSFTAPLDVARLSAVSPMFKSAAISDVVWERFLPSDLESVLSTSPDGSLLLASVSSKRELYFSLCDNPILVDNGRKSFSLEKKSGKKCYMLSAMDLVIRWSDSPHYWKWNSNPASRFPEVAELIKVSWLEIRGKFNTSMLSPSILYTANLVFKFSISAYGLVDQPVEVAMKLDGDKICEHSVSWNAERRPVDFFIYSCRRSIPARESDGHYPKKRGDGWLEIELGDFLCTEGEDGELEMRVFDGINYWKHGLIVEGIEIRPKEGFVHRFYHICDITNMYKGLDDQLKESDGHYPRERGDGWLEIELGDFFTKEREDGELEMKVFDSTSHWKAGFTVEGIEIRPKEELFVGEKDICSHHGISELHGVMLLNIGDGLLILDQERQPRWRHRSPRRPIIGSSAAESNWNYPKERGDGWSEIEMGVLTKEGEEEELETWVDCRRD
ncbi:hypothetical protein NC653_039041 [Populus alba x Populus x berolinensis]|uniref:F-box domain-containing protein n=1 Tax=Populus alba x Populus x berolinensis TaxID=444605 RepID=A0AAD6PPX8_9ROSI|nr:hypothetical protein NC653_039041 [Populus alba x Populus x berolinensis]